MKQPLRHLAICIALLPIPLVSPAQCEVFSDGFETGSYTNNWTAAGGTYTRTVTLANPASGTYAFEQAGVSTHMQGTRATFAPSQPTSVSYYVKTDASATSGGYFVIGDANTTTNFGIYFGYFSNNGNIRIVSNASAIYQQPYTVNTWYKIELRNIDWATKTYDIYINNVLGQANFPFRTQSSNDVDRIYLYNLASMTASYDEVEVGGIPLNLAFTATDITCAADSNGTLSVTPNGGTPNFTYLWSNNDTTAAISNLLPGTYSVTVTDSNGCVGTGSATVNSPAPLQSNTVASDALCNGDSTGAIDLSVSGGTIPYTYAWSNTATSEDLSSLPAGGYSVVITDANNCQWTDTASIAEPSALLLSAALTDVLCQGDSSGAIDLTPSGGTPGYSFTWNTSAVTEDLTNLTAGSYTVFVSDANGCSNGDIFTISEPSAITLGATVTANTGSNNGAIDLTPSGGTPPYTYSWSNGATTQDLNNLRDSTYTVVVTDANGCTVRDTLVVDLMVAIDPVIGGPEIALYPNPSAGHVQVIAELPAAGPARLSVHDLQGQLLHEEAAEIPNQRWELQLNLDDLAAGIYLLRVESQGQTAFRRLVRQ